MTVAFIVSSCDTPTAQLEPERPLLDIPAHGATALPGSPNFSVPTGTQGQQTYPPAYHILQKYAKEHPEDPYIAVVGVWNAEKERYDYKSLPLAFPENITRKADGEIAYYQYKLTWRKDSTYRTLAAFIPSRLKAKALMTPWLKVRPPDSAAENTAVATGSKHRADIFTDVYSEPLPCKDIVIGGQWIFYDCEGTVVTADGPKVPETHVPNEGWPGGGSGLGDMGDGNGGGGCPANCSGSGEGIPLNDNILSNYPEVKYPPSSNYAQMYPKLTEYLKNQLPTLNDNQIIIDAIIKYGDLSATKVKEDLQWGKGPTIKVVQLDNYVNCDTDCLGQYSEADPNTLYIDVDLVNDLEINNALANSFSFLIGVTILHEYVYFSEWTDRSWNNPESGVLFEKDVYGQTVWRDNAKLMLKK